MSLAARVNDCGFRCLAHKPLGLLSVSENRSRDYLDKGEPVDEMAGYLVISESGDDETNRRPTMGLSGVVRYSRQRRHIAVAV